MSPNINVKSTTYLHTNLTNEQSNWVPKLQRLSVQQIFHLSKKKHCRNWMERGRVPKEQSNSVGKLRRIEDWWSVKKILQQMDGKSMSAKWANHMCWNAGRKTWKLTFPCVKLLQQMDGRDDWQMSKATELKTAENVQKWKLDGKRMIDRWAKAIELEAAENVMQVGLTSAPFFVHIEEHSRLDSIVALQTCHMSLGWHFVTECRKLIFHNWRFCF